MKTVLPVIIFFLFFIQNSLRAQIENVIVETYYISDANDATDTTGGKLDSGSVTYRIYIDLVKGSKLTKIYGDANHPLKISSTAVFFNNISEDGRSFAKDIDKIIRLKNNTVAVDSWLTLGRVGPKDKKTGVADFGILKTQDNNGSLVGGSNNDGGSAGMPGGLLVNTNPVAGIPLTTADGLATMIALDSNWSDYGIRDITTGLDSTIFGPLKPGTQFLSYNAGLHNSGVTGVVPDSNQILVAQLTTKGKISFELNIVVLDSAGNLINYIANGHDTTYTVNNIKTIERYSPYLTYPPICGCMDKDYLEYNPHKTCNNQDSCKHLVVIGCMDSKACNYNSKANFNIQGLCCYPGLCQDRDISLVCPNLGIDEITGKPEFRLYPNPARLQLEFRLTTPVNQKMIISIYDYYGRLVFEKNLDGKQGELFSQIEIADLVSGLYLFRLTIGGTSTTKLFIKE